MDRECVEHDSPIAIASKSTAIALEALEHIALALRVRLLEEVHGIDLAWVSKPIDRCRLGGH